MGFSALPSKNPTEPGASPEAYPVPHERFRAFAPKAVPSNFMNGQRISTHLFNSERDVDTLVAALRSELT